MKHLQTFFTIFTLFTFYALQLGAQNISVTDFHLDEMDLTANQQGTTVLDQNGEKCALIKVKTTQTGFSFDAGSLGVTKTLQKTAEIWVYVPHGVRKLNISHQKFGQLDYQLPVTTQKAKTYIMDVKAETPLPVDHQRLSIKCQPNNAVVMIDGEPVDITNGIGELTLNLGSHSYIAWANGYYKSEGTIKLDADRPGKLSIELYSKDAINEENVHAQQDVQQTQPLEERNSTGLLTAEDFESASKSTDVKHAQVNGKTYYYVVVENKPYVAVIVAQGKEYRKFKEVNLPETFVGSDGKTYTIAGIGNKAFKDCGSIKNVSLSKNVVFIGDEAFSGTNINTLTLKEGLKQIGNRAFLKNDLHDIYIPEGVEKIGDEAFYCKNTFVFNRESSGKLYIPKSVSYIGEHAFSMARKGYGAWFNSKREILCLPEYINLDNCNQMGISRDPVELYLNK